MRQTADRRGGCGRIETLEQPEAPINPPLGPTTSAPVAEPAIAETLGCLLTRDRIVGSRVAEVPVGGTARLRRSDPTPAVETRGPGRLSPVSCGRTRPDRCQSVRVAGSDRNWMHDRSFDPDAMVEFERRLARARAASRPGYLRVKAATLLELDDPAARRIAIGLLSRVVDHYEHFLDVPWSHELLGEAYRRDGDLDSAERHLRLCLQTADDRRNGTTGVTELSLAEVLLEKGRVAEAGELLALDHLRRHLFWKAQLFRYAVAAARYEARSGGHAQPWARQALEIARDHAPQLPRHPNIGLPQPDDATITEMERLALRD